jgi:hypothetical protein
MVLGIGPLNVRLNAGRAETEEKKLSACTSILAHHSANSLMRERLGTQARVQMHRRSIAKRLIRMRNALIPAILVASLPEPLSPLGASSRRVPRRFREELDQVPEVVIEAPTTHKRFHKCGIRCDIVHNGRIGYDGARILNVCRPDVVALDHTAHHVRDAIVEIPDIDGCSGRQGCASVELRVQPEDLVQVHFFVDLVERALYSVVAWLAADECDGLSYHVFVLVEVDLGVQGCTRRPGTVGQVRVALTEPRDQCG